MMKQTPPSELQIILVDALIAGSAIGIAAYSYFWLALSLWTGINHSSPSFFLLHAGIILLGAITTYFFVHHRSNTPNQLIYVKQHYLIICILLSALHWGALSTYMIYFMGFSPEQQYMIKLILTGFATIGGTIFGIVKNIGFYYTVLVFAPHILVSNWLNTPNVNFLTLITLTLIGFIYITNRVIQYNYVRFVQTYRHTKDYASSMEDMSKTDYLTRLNNRFSFHLDYLSLWRDSVNKHEPISILYIEMADLTHITRKHGHYIEELCLIRTARLLSEAIEAPNILASYESGKFIIAMPNTTQQSANTQADHLINLINKTELINGQADTRLDNVIGSASSLPVVGDNPEQLIESAIKTAHAQKYPSKLGSLSTS